MADCLSVPLMHVQDTNLIMACQMDNLSHIKLYYIDLGTNEIMPYTGPITDEGFTQLSIFRNSSASQGNFAIGS